jgi:hypothetical protein
VVTLTLEMMMISLQAWRGTTSHFNVATPFDGVLFSVMGLAILLQTLSSVAVAVALWRQDFADRTIGWALRLGLTITIVGAATGGLMTRPTPAQLADARVSRMTVAGAHTVGAPDGGPGLPGTGWSLEHGDLRVPHFLGLHALQALVGVALVVTRIRRPERDRVRLILVAGGSYASLFVLLLWQALQGESVSAPTATTSMALVGWALVTLVVSRLAVGRAVHSHVRAAIC